MEEESGMNFIEALQILGIQKYAERIWHSNSHGELFHLHQYFVLAKLFKDDKVLLNNFPEWFERVVKCAEENWERPESVFQHIQEIIVKELEREQVS
jgi:hypothetical protein